MTTEEAIWAEYWAQWWRQNRSVTGRSSTWRRARAVAPRRFLVEPMSAWTAVRAHKAAILRAKLVWLGWTSAHLAAHLGVRGDTVRRWMYGAEAVPDRVWVALDAVDPEGLVVQARQALDAGRAWDRPATATAAEGGHPPTTQGDTVIIPKERVRIVLCDENMPETEQYGDYRGYAVEVDGEWAVDAPDHDAACAIAAKLTQTTATGWSVHLMDGRGQHVWTHR